jgi:hypothetical protein
MSKEGSAISTPDLSGAVWRKSNHSGANEGECVEIAAVPERQVAARDSKDPYGPVLCFGQTAWRAFCTGVKSGSYDPARLH